MRRVLVAVDAGSDPGVTPYAGATHGYQHLPLTDTPDGYLVSRRQPGFARYLDRERDLIVGRHARHAFTLARLRVKELEASRM